MTNQEFEMQSKNIATLMQNIDGLLLKEELHFERTKITEKLIEAGMWLKMSWDMVRAKDLKVEVKPKLTLKPNEAQEKK